MFSLAVFILNYSNMLCFAWSEFIDNRQVVISVINIR